jgi:hypothetical protein
MILKDIGIEMAQQDNRATQYPLFVVMEDVHRYVDYHDDWDRKERIDPDYLKENVMCNRCLNLLNNTGEVPDDCDDCSDEAFAYYKLEEEVNVNAGVFFTAKACDLHIKDNHYHYNNARSYGISAWRNPEMQAVMQSLIKGARQKVPSHYV